MIKTRYIFASLATTAMVSFGALGVASAATITNPKATGNVGSSTIPRATFQTDRQQAVATTLKTIPKTNKKAFHAQVKVELTNELKAQGYSQDQITIALQHKALHHQRHQHHKK